MAGDGVMMMMRARGSQSGHLFVGVFPAFSFFEAGRGQRRARRKGRTGKGGYIWGYSTAC